MTIYADKPTHNIPPEDRCEAMAQGNSNDWRRWAKEPHRCLKRAAVLVSNKWLCRFHEERT